MNKSPMKFLYHSLVASLFTVATSQLDSGFTSLKTCEGDFNDGVKLGAELADLIKESTGQSCSEISDFKDTVGEYVDTSYPQDTGNWKKNSCHAGVKAGSNQFIDKYEDQCLAAPSSGFKLDWVTTVEAPETPEEPTQEQNEHILAVDDQAITISGESVDIDVLSNDIVHSADKSDLLISLRSRGKNGYCVIHEDTNFIVYYPKYRYAGYDECEYILCDVDKFCDSAKVTITIVKAVEFSDETLSDPNRPAIDEILEGLDIAGNNDVGDNPTPQKPHKPAIDHMPAKPKPPKEDSNDLSLIDFNEPVHSSDTPMNFVINDAALDSFKCPSDHASIMIEVQADKYGDDTTWTLSREYENGTSTLELSGGPYDSNGFSSKHICAPKPSKWTFSISDEYGDGELRNKI